MDMLNDFLVNTGALKKGEYITNIKEALQMVFPKRVRRMRDEIVNETTKNRDEQIASMLKNKLNAYIEKRTLSYS